MLHARRKGTEGRRGDREEQEALGRGSGSTSKRLPKFLIPLLALILLVSLQKFPSRRWRQQKRNNDSNGNEQQQNGRRNNGSSVFIDVGANCGNSYWKLKDDPKSGVLDPDEDWEVYLWECNPQMNEFFLRELAASNPSIHLIEKAASTVVRVCSVCVFVLCARVCVCLCVCARVCVCVHSMLVCCRCG